MKIFKKGILALLILALVLCAAGCWLWETGYKDPNQKDMLLHLTLDEGSGVQVRDASKNLDDATLKYVFTDAQYMPSQDPQWREKGVLDGCLLFDGYSNYISYDYSEVKIRGSYLSISAWVAPRMFEWDNPNAAENGSEILTTIAGQYYKPDNAGFILGYQRHGAWSFQVGIGDRWLTLWDEGNPLKKYEWNHVSAVFDGEKGEMSIYLNGEMINYATFFEGAEIAPAYDEPLLIAKNAYADSNATASCNMVSGLMDDIRIYDCALSEKNVKDYYDYCQPGEIAFEDIWLQNILTEDYTKTQYHGGPYQHWMNEPHAPMYYNGKYHLFFQFNLNGPYFRNICWGHLVSDDMVNWTPMKEVITPTAGTVAPDGVWSGGVTYDENGVPILFFTAGNDSFASSGDGLISNQNLGVAYPADPSDPNLTEWIVCDELAIKQQPGQGRRGEFRDAHIWQEDGKWFLLVGSGSTSAMKGTALLYVSDTLKCNFDGTVDMNWQYKGPVYEIDNQKGDLGRVWELPLILPLENEAGTVRKYIFIISPAPADSADNKIYYFLGDFNKETGKFTPDPEFADGNPHLLDYGCNVFTGPSGFIDPVSGEAYVFSIMQDQRSPGVTAASGWAHCVGLARRIWLNDEGTDVCIEATPALDNYKSEPLYETNRETPMADVNAAIANIGKDMMYVEVTFRNINAESFGIRMKMNEEGTDLTTYYYDVKTATIFGSTLDSGANASSSRVSGGLKLNEDGTLTMKIYVDRSLVEAFFNDRKAISTRSYAARDSVGMEVYCSGGEAVITHMIVQEVASIYE